MKKHISGEMHLLFPQDTVPPARAPDHFHNPPFVPFVKIEIHPNVFYIFI